MFCPSGTMLWVVWCFAYFLMYNCLRLHPYEASLDRSLFLSKGQNNIPLCIVLFLCSSVSEKPGHPLVVCCEHRWFKHLDSLLSNHWTQLWIQSPPLLNPNSFRANISLLIRIVLHLHKDLTQRGYAQKEITFLRGMASSKVGKKIKENPP